MLSRKGKLCSVKKIESDFSVYEEVHIMCLEGSYLIVIHNQTKYSTVIMFELIRNVILFFEIKLPILKGICNRP